MFKNSNNKKAIAIIASFLVACGLYAWFLENVPWIYGPDPMDVYIQKTKMYGTYISKVDGSMILIFEDEPDNFYFYTGIGKLSPIAYKGTIRKIADQKYIFTDTTETDHEVSFGEQNFSLEFGKDSDLIYEKSDIGT
ncbi:MAG: hypothetical protein Q4A75_06965, partial [Peptostreptococcaceae bacterium]|nr:hypothetical protein [Peptostreptococcaceae bacterium]